MFWFVNPAGTILLKETVQCVPTSQGEKLTILKEQVRLENTDVRQQMEPSSAATGPEEAILAGICVALLILVLPINFVVAAKCRQDKEQYAVRFLGR